MRTGKLMAILIAFAFIFVAIISCVILFSVKEVRVSYAVAEETDVSSVSKKFDAFIGKSLVFLDLQDVETSIDDPSLKVVSVDKQFPNVLTVKVEQRREVYKFLYDGKIFTADEQGFVFHSYNYDGGDVSDRQTINLNFENVQIGTVEVGKYLKTTDDELLKVVYDMAKAVDLTDRVKSISIVNTTLEGNPHIVVMRSAEFVTYTGVRVLIENAYEYGKERIVAAFNAYDNSSDYVKTFDVIRAFRITETGEIKVVFSSGYNQNEG